MPIVKKVGKGKYLVRVYKGTGQLRYTHNKTLKCTLAEANKYAAEIQSQIDRGRSPYSLETLLKYSKIWLSRIDVAPNTSEHYERVIRLYAIPLHETILFKITEKHIQALYDSMTVSPNTIRHLHSALRAMFNYAVKKRHLPENPVLFADPPKRIRPKVDCWGAEDAARVIAACDNSLRGLVFELALETGMRPQEYLALRKRDIVFNSASVTQTVSRDGKTFGPPKTNASRRLVPLSNALLEKISAIDHPYELLFCTELGTAYSQRNIARDLSRIIKDTKVKKISLYGLRHTCATLMLLSGEHPKIVSERLGHTSVTTTLDKYSHVLPTMQEAATDRLSAMLRGSAHSERIVHRIESDLVN